MNGTGPYVLKYYVNGLVFRRAYESRAARDLRASVLVTNGVTVVVSKRIVALPPCPPREPRHEPMLTLVGASP